LNNTFIQKEKKFFLKKKRFIIPLTFIFLLASFIIFSITYISSDIKKPVSSNAKELKFTISDGESTQDISDRLKKDGLIRNSLIFTVYLKYKGKSSSLQVGDYTLNTKYSALEVMEILTKGKVTSGKITIPEGWTKKQIGEELVKKGIGSKEEVETALNKKYDRKFLGESPSGNLEGFLFPDTYFLSSRAKPGDVIEKMLDEFGKKADSDIRSKTEKEGLSYYQTLILASIVEREVVTKEDKRKVAGVFLNRLNSGIRLDSCATVEFVLGTKKRILSEEDIAIDSPYNTYRVDGLPPTPISNPGLDSIEAVLNPEETDYIFFFSGRDGKTYFSKTSDEHEALKARYL